MGYPGLGGAGPRWAVLCWPGLRSPGRDRAGRAGPPGQRSEQLARRALVGRGCRVPPAHGSQPIPSRIPRPRLARPRFLLCWLAEPRFVSRLLQPRRRQSVTGLQCRAASPASRPPVAVHCPLAVQPGRPAEVRMVLARCRVVAGLPIARLLAVRKPASMHVAAVALAGVALAGYVRVVQALVVVHRGRVMSARRREPGPEPS